MILLLAAAAAACPNLDAEVERATAAVLAGDYAAARGALDEAAASFTCAAATPAQLGRYWLVEGAVLHLRGEPDAARAPLAAARTTAPEQFDERLGPKVRAAWTSAAAEGEGTLLLEPQREASLDGVSVSAWPAPVSAAPHVVQVLGADGGVRFGKLVRIAPGEDALVETGPIPDDPLPLEPLEEPRHKKSVALLVVAGVAAAGAGACAGGALAQDAQMRAATDVATLDTVYERQQILGYSSYGLAGVAALSVGFHFLLP